MVVSRRFFRDLSFSRRGLWISCMTLLALGLAAAAVVDTVVRPARERQALSAWTPDVLESLLTLWREGGLHPADWMDDPLLEIIAMMQHGNTPRALERARELTLLPEPPAGVHFLLGLHHLDGGNPGPAADHFEEEDRHHPHPLAKRFLLDTLARGRMESRIDALGQDPDYAPLMRGRYWMRTGLRRGDWGRVLKHFWIAEYTGRTPGAILLALFSGAIWMGILLHIYPPGFLRPMLGPVFLALALGWVSAWVTLLAGMALDQGGWIRDGADFGGQLLYQLLYVALREEAAKLLLFAPLLPRVLKRGNELDALLLGAMVGLGFAIRENLTYFESPFGGAQGVGRFASATLFHCLLTGSCSLALTRWVREPARWTQDSLMTIAAAVGLHGLYNTLQTHPVPGLGDMSYFAGTCLAIAAMLFFREVATRGTFRGRALSITGLFFWGFCLLINLELVLMTLVLPLPAALGIVGQTVLGAALFAFVFLHHVQEPLVE